MSHPDRPSAVSRRDQVQLELARAVLERQVRDREPIDSETSNGHVREFDHRLKERGTQAVLPRPQSRYDVREADVAMLEGPERGGLHLPDEVAEAHIRPKPHRKRQEVDETAEHSLLRRRDRRPDGQSVDAAQSRDRGAKRVKVSTDAGRSGCLGQLARQSSTLPGKPFFVPSPTIRFAERAEGVKGPKR
jgi:hypothetical protein